jgi:hypothetical protein
MAEYEVSMNLYSTKFCVKPVPLFRVMIVTGQRHLKAYDREIYSSFSCCIFICSSCIKVGGEKLDWYFFEHLIKTHV